MSIMQFSRRYSALLLVCVFITHILTAEVLIITPAYNQPHFIKYQYETFKKFLENDHRFVVYNDAPAEPMRTRINATCTELGIQCVTIPQKIHTYAYLHREPGESFTSPAVRNCNVVQYALNEIGFKHNDIVVLIDSDMFLVKKFNLTQYMSEYDIAGLAQSAGYKVYYLWIGLAFLNMATLPNKEEINFNCGRIEGIPVDAGGYTHHYIKNYPTIRKKYFGVLHSDHFQYDRSWLKENNLNDIAIEFILKKPHNIEFLLDGHFMHYRGGSNWDHKSVQYHKIKADLLQEYITNLLAQGSQ